MELMIENNAEWSEPMPDLKDVAKYTQSDKKLTTLATSKIQQNSSFQWTYASGCLFVEVWRYCWGCASGESGRPLRAGEGGTSWPLSQGAQRLPSWMVQQPRPSRWLQTAAHWHQPGEAAQAPHWETWDTSGAKDPWSGENWDQWVKDWKQDAKVLSSDLPLCSARHLGLRSRESKDHEQERKHLAVQCVQRDAHLPPQIFRIQIRPSAPSHRLAGQVKSLNRKLATATRTTSESSPGLDRAVKPSSHDDHPTSEE